MHALLHGRDTHDLMNLGIGQLSHIVAAVAAASSHRKADNVARSVDEARDLMRRLETHTDKLDRSTLSATRKPVSTQMSSTSIETYRSTDWTDELLTPVLQTGAVEAVAAGVRDAIALAAETEAAYDIAHTTRATATTSKRTGWWRLVHHATTAAVAVTTRRICSGG